jgi:hypothetical protein
MESLEPRLALTWAGVPPVSITPPSAASVTLNSQSDASGSASIAATEVDYLAFTARSTGSYTLSASTPSSNLDTVIGVFNSAGQRLSYNDDLASTNTDSRLTVNLTAGSRYYFGVTNYATNSRGSYSWTIDGPAVSTTPTDDAYENNDSLSTAYNLGTLTSVRSVSALKLVDAEDWYRFTTSATGTSGSSVSISFQNTQGNLQLALYNASGTLLTTSATTGNSETISLSGRAAGTYNVRVYGNFGATNANYSLTVTPPIVTAPPPPTNSGGFQITLSMSGLTASQQAIFNQAADEWEQVIVGDLPNTTYSGQVIDDLLINASAVSIDGVNGVLGQAGPDALRSGSRLPYHGIMQFDTADLANMQQNGTLLGVVMHEMGHVLGIGTIWSSLGLLSGASTSNPTFRGVQATAAYNQLFGTSASGVPVENSGGSGTRDAHWRDSIFRNELMTGWVGPGTNLPMSRVTVASLADIGYTVNMAMADPFTPSSSVIASVQASTGVSSPTPVRLSGLYAEPVRLAPAGVRGWVETVSQQTAASLPRSSLLTRPPYQDVARRFHEQTVDAVMNETHGGSDEADSTRLASTDDALVADYSNAWEELGESLRCWPTLSMKGSFYGYSLQALRHGS